jgi:hypothetical protein
MIGTLMDIQVPGQHYIDKAELAEEYALQATDAVTKNTWLRIAVSYRDLAEFVQKNSAKGFSWVEVPPSNPEVSRQT